MRILISKDDRIKLKRLLKEKYQVRSVSSLGIAMNMPQRSLENWFYTKRHIPKEKISEDILVKLKILDERKDNWGRILGGKKTYQTIIRKYGISEIRKRQRNGGKKSIQIIKDRNKDEPLQINITDPIFLEFYGIVVGDGWLSKIVYKNKINYLIGISGHKEFDKELHIYCRNNIIKMFNRKPYLKEIRTCNGRELIFSHKELFNFLVNELNFPIGKKKDISLPAQISSYGYESIKHVIRGMFDTDGSFYLDKTPAGHPYPCICITMKQPTLINQIRETLLQQGFKVQNRKDRYPICEIKIKGSKQLKKWMDEIGSSNPYKFAKMQKALVAQLDSATPS